MGKAPLVSLLVVGSMVHSRMLASFLAIVHLALLGSASVGPCLPPLLDPPCTSNILKARFAGETHCIDAMHWRSKCITAMFQRDQCIDLAFTSFFDPSDSEPDFTRFLDFTEANLTNLSGSKFMADGGFGDALINFTEANLTNADLSGSGLNLQNAPTIGFAGANLDLSGAIAKKPENWRWKIGAGCAALATLASWLSLGALAIILASL